MKENVIIAAKMKPYTVNCDGESILVKNLVCIGFFKDGQFRAADFTKENGRITFDGTSCISEKDFNDRVESWREVV